MGMRFLLQPTLVSPAGQPYRRAWSRHRDPGAWV